MEKRNFLERALTGPNEWWKYLLVFFVGLLGGQVIGSLPLLITVLIRMISTGEFTSFTSENLLSKNLAFGLIIFSTFVSLVLTVVLIGAINHRTSTEIVNGTKIVRRDRVVFAFAVSFVLMAIYSGIDYFWHPDNYVLQTNWGKFAVFFVLSVVSVPILGIYSELLFRGYLTQGIGAGTHSRWWAWILPALIFALFTSIMPSQASREFGISYMASSSLFLGLLLGLIAILDDGIELSIGFIVGTSLFPMLFVTHSASPIPTESLFRLKQFDPHQDVISTMLIGLIAFVIFYRKYRWNFKIMNQRVGKKETRD
ncbi:MAG: hypothetical protein LBE91_12720 [Tannerella sp.]|jgi:hypothetical protein|nr:hypothetical protein [Tannerella sp.]